ncbi:hypothetical protein Dimus_019496 [Dionaea muscipula]
MAITPLKRVIVYNNLGPGILLTIHCKSKNDDLGVVELPYSYGFSFSFHPNVFSSTQYWCWFKWGEAFHYYDVYVDKRDDGDPTCDRLCPCRYAAAAATN